MKGPEQASEAVILQKAARSGPVGLQPWPFFTFGTHFLPKCDARTCRKTPNWNKACCRTKRGEVCLHNKVTDRIGVSSSAPHLSCIALLFQVKPPNRKRNADSSWTCVAYKLPLAPTMAPERCFKPVRPANQNHLLRMLCAWKTWPIVEAQKHINSKHAKASTQWGSSTWLPVWSRCCAVYPWGGRGIGGRGDGGDSRPLVE